MHCLNFLLLVFSSFCPFNSLLSFRFPLKRQKKTTCTKTWTQFVNFVICFQLLLPAFTQAVSSQVQSGGGAYGLKSISFRLPGVRTWCENLGDFSVWNYRDKLDSVSVTVVPLSFFFFFYTHFPVSVNSFFHVFIVPSKEKRNSSTHQVLTVRLYTLQRNYSYAMQMYINSLKEHIHKILYARII